MTSEINPAGYVRRASEMIGLRIEPDDEGAVVAIFANLVRAADSLAVFALPETVEPAATFVAFDDGGR